MQKGRRKPAFLRLDVTVRCRTLAVAAAYARPEHPPKHKAGIAGFCLSAAIGI